MDNTVVAMNLHLDDNVESIGILMMNNDNGFTLVFLASAVKDIDDWYGDEVEIVGNGDAAVVAEEEGDVFCGNM